MKMINKFNNLSSKAKTTVLFLIWTVSFLGTGLIMMHMGDKFFEAMGAILFMITLFTVFVGTLTKIVERD